MQKKEEEKRIADSEDAAIPSLVTRSMYVEASPHFLSQLLKGDGDVIPEVGRIEDDIFNSKTIPSFNLEELRVVAVPYSFDLSLPDFEASQTITLKRLDCPDCEDSQFCHSSRVSHPQLHFGNPIS
ncbi:hypothetical protein Tco_0078503 [Tanacetum coccineum]